MTAGQTATFTAAASGNPTPTVQWQVSIDGGSTFSNISGATSTTLTLSNTAAAQNGDEYQAVFSNSVGTATTSAATLTVDFAPTVTTQPASQTVTAGQTATFTAAASGNPTPTVQWQVSTNGGSTFSNISGATSTTLTLSNTTTAQNGDEYQAVFSNSVGTATTSAATLTVNTAQFAPTVTTQPASQTVTAGQTATFTAAASGNPTPTVQWQVSTNGGSTFSNIPGATSTTFSFTATAAQNGDEYQAVFSNSVGTATTSAATLTVDFAPTVTTQPASQTVTAGQTATFTAAASGNPTPTVQWQVSTNGGSTFSNILGATSTTLSFTATAAQNGDEYQAVFSNSIGTATTSAATLTTVLSPGVYAVGTTLYVVGANTSDYALISPWGSKLDGSTGLAVVATINNAITAKTFSQTFTAIDIFGYGGNDVFLLIPTLTLPTTVVEGNGNNYLLLAGGNDSVTLGSGSNQVFGGNGNKTITDADAAGTSAYISLGNGNDTISLGAGNDTVSLGNGNDYVTAGSGNDNVTVGNGNDNVQLGNGSDVIVEGNGNDYVSAGNGPDLVVGGLGQHTIQLGNGNDILIDGSATVVKPGDSLRQILSDWNASKSASVNTRLKVVYNTSHPNVLKAGSGRDWFFYTYPNDTTNKKSTDRVD